jgi:hypothetical protein
MCSLSESMELIINSSHSVHAEKILYIIPDNVPATTMGSSGLMHISAELLSKCPNINLEL